MDEPVAEDDGTAFSYFHADGLGSLVKVSNTSGAVSLTRQYEAWGSLALGASESGYAFTGREWDPETGLYYYRARHYDPRIGRFISEDPIGFSGGINYYSYVRNNPALLFDPSGLKETPGQICRVVPRVRPSAPAPPGPGMGPLLGAIAMLLLNPTSAGGPGDEIGDVVCEPEPCDDDDDNSFCDKLRDQCLEQPTQNRFRQKQWGKRKDCGACYRHCKRLGWWPFDKCPLFENK